MKKDNNYIFEAKYLCGFISCGAFIAFEYDAVHSLYSNKVSSTFLQKFDHFPCTKNQVKDTILIARKRTIRISKKNYQYWNKKKSKYANEGKIYAKLALNPCGKNSVPNFKGQLKGENKTFLAF